LNRVAAKEQPESKPPAPEKQTRPQIPEQDHHGFDTPHSLTLAGRLNQLCLIETG